MIQTFSFLCNKLPFNFTQLGSHQMLGSYPSWFSPENAALALRCPGMCRCLKSSTHHPVEVSLLPGVGDAISTQGPLRDHSQTAPLSSWPQEFCFNGHNF